MTIKEIINDEIKLYESSMNRVLSHVKKENIDSWGIITAFRGGNSKSANMKLNKQLASDLRANDLGFFKLDGHWQECSDNTIEYDDCPKDQLSDVAEKSLFIPKINFKLLAKLTKKYNQDSSVYSGKEVKDNIVLIYRNGKIQVIGKDATPNKISQAYSKLRGRPFVFEYNL